MRKELRRELKCGLLCYTVPLILNQFITVPELFMGFFLGLAICLEMIGILPDKYYNRLKTWKHSLLHRTK